MSDKYEVSTGSAFNAFPKLVGDNYWGWRDNIIPMMNILNQMCVLDGSVVVPAAPADPTKPTTAELKAVADHQLRLRRAFAELSLRIDPDWRQPISDLGDKPAEAWKKLEEAYGSKLAGTRAVLFGELTSTRYDGTSSIQVFYGRLEELRSKLKVAGQSLDDMHFLNFFLNALPSSFDQFVSTVNYEKDSIAEVVARLRQLELRRTMIAARDGHGAETAFVANNKSKRESKGKKKGDGSGGSNDKLAKVTCFNCQQKGHYARKCPAKRKDNGGGKKGDNKGDGSAAKAPVGALFTAMEEEVAMATTEEVHARTYYLDSGASGHYIPEKDDLHDYRPLSPPVKIVVANKESVLALGAGTLRAASRVNNSDIFIELRDVYWVPDLGTRLLSIGKLADAGYETTFTRAGCRVAESGGRLVGEVTAQGRIYPLRLRAIRSESAMLAAEPELVDASDRDLAGRLADGLMALAAKAGITKEVLHKRMGHAGESELHILESMEGTGLIVHKDDADRQGVPTLSRCGFCLVGKQPRLPFPEGRTRTTDALDLLHMDVAGPMEETAIGGYKYYVVIVDDYTRIIYVKGLVQKSDVAKVFTTFQAAIENSTGKTCVSRYHPLQVHSICASAKRSRGARDSNTEQWRSINAS